MQQRNRSKSKQREIKFSVLAFFEIQDSIMKLRPRNQFLLTTLPPLCPLPSAPHSPITTRALWPDV